MFFFADIGANLTDEMFDGVYNGSKKHDPDRTQVLERAWHVGVEKVIITVGTIFDCEPAFKIAATDGEIYLDLETRSIIQPSPSFQIVSTAQLARIPQDAVNS